MPTELMERFSRKQWKDCCGKGCKKCEIAQTYIGAYGKKKGLDLLNDDRAAVKRGKASKKAAKGAGKGKPGAKAGPATTVAKGAGGKKGSGGKKGKKGAKK